MRTAWSLLLVAACGSSASTVVLAPPASTPSAASPQAPVPAARGGSLSGENAVAVVSARGDDVRACYERALEKDPKLVGKLRVRLVVGLDGAVSRAEALADRPDAMTNEDVVACALGILRALRFDRPQGGPAELVVPFAFTPQAADGGA